MPAGQTYKLGRNQTLSFGSLITNANVQNVNLTFETAAEAEVTSRGSADIQEFLPVRRNITVEVTCWDHTCALHSTGVLTVAPATGTTGTAITGVYYVNNISEPQEIDGAIAWTIQLKRHASTTGTA